MKPRGFLVSLASLAVFAAAPGPAARAALLVHTNDVMGELEPCGCRSNPLGGLPRLANLLQRQTDHGTLFLDAGDLLFNSDVIPELLGAQSEVQAKLLLEGMEKMGLDARVPGERDFARGVKFFDSLAKKKSKVLAANLQRRAGGLAYGDHAIFERRLDGIDENGKKLRIGVFGIVDAKLNWPKALRATPHLAAARAQVAALRAKKVDVVIALTHLGQEQDEALAKQVKGIDYIVGSHTQSFLQTPPRIGATWILQSSFRNQYVGILPLHAKAPDPEAMSTAYKLVPLDANFDSPAGQLGEMDRFLDRFKQTIADFNSKRDAELNAAVKTGQGKFHTFGKCAECHLKQFDFWRKTQHTLAFTTLFKAQQNKNKDCLRCHTVGLGDPDGFSDVNRVAEVTPIGTGDTLTKPEAFPHEELSSFLKDMQSAKALDTKLKLRASDGESDTVQRHLNRVRSWTPVQCENCHRPGGDHPFGGTYSKQVATETCLQCHTQDRAPGWYTKEGRLDAAIVEKKRALVACPAGELEQTD